MPPQDPIHIVGGGLAGSECAWQLARRGLPVVLHEMRPERPTPGAQDGRLRRAGVQQLVPQRRPEPRRRPAQARDGGVRLAGHRLGARRRGAGGGRAGGRPRALRRARHRRARRPPGNRDPARRGHRAARRRRRAGHRSADVRGHVRGAGGSAGRRIPLFLRRHRADRRRRQPRHGHPVRRLALRQGRRRRLPERADGQGAIPGLPPGGDGGRGDAAPRLRAGPLLRGLPADRGDGTARRRHPALRADEAGGPDQARPAPRPTPSSSCGRRTWPGATTTWSASSHV